MAAVYRGGTDESTFGPFVRVQRNAFSNVGKRMTGGFEGAIHLHGVQTALVAQNAFSDSAPVTIVHTVGTPKTSLLDNSFSETPAPILSELIFEGEFRADMRDNAIGGGGQQ